MSNELPAAGLSWRRSRYGFAGFWFLSLLVLWFLLRVLLFLAFKPPGLPVADIVLAFLSGFHRDLFAALAGTIPLLLWMLIVPNRRFGGRLHRVWFLSCCFVLWFIQIFLLFVEFFFFDEFKSRFNTVAVDYLLYPREVFINIWESYHVGVFLAMCAVLTVAWLFAATGAPDTPVAPLTVTRSRAFSICRAVVNVTRR